jgi:hypothetical protein
MDISCSLMGAEVSMHITESIDAALDCVVYALPMELYYNIQQLA